MNCPICKQAMLVLESEQVEIDYCASCGGIWLDAGELELLLENAVEAHLLLQSFTSAHTRQEKRKCPICRRKMEKIIAGHQTQQAVLLDRCRNNHGLWLDRGELQQLMEKGNFDKEGKVQHLLGELFSTRNPH
jgi:hypothetical protein